jgi:hypothetical protein
LRGIVAADLDRDVDSTQASGTELRSPNADMDLVAYGPGGVLILENAVDKKTGERSLKASPQPAALEQTRKVFAVSGITVCRGGPNGHFSEVLDLFDDSPTHVETCEVGDVDGDGDLDLLTIESEYPVWYANHGGNRNHWLDVRLQADPYPTQSPDLAVNMHGIGSLLELKAGARRQQQLVTRATSHFGLGPVARADVLRILWTNGTACNAIRPESNQILVKAQKHAGM